MNPMQSASDVKSESKIDGTRGSPDNLANLEVHEPLVVTRNGGFEAHAEPRLTQLFVAALIIFINS
jgi:electron transfer flavoprotein alpha/beta subunit